MVNLYDFGFVVYKKHYPPALNDEVWRLEKIGKDGSFHKRLNKSGIFTVEDFLRLVVRDSQRLRNVRISGFACNIVIFFCCGILIWLSLLYCLRYSEVECQIKCGMHL